MTRCTNTGKIYEKEVKTLLLEHSKHKVQSHVNIGKKRNGGKHYVDLLLNSDVLLSLKYQEVQGTAEEKIPFEIMKLQHAIDDYGYSGAMLVLAGPESAWKWRDYFLSDEFQSEMKKIYPDVRLLSNSQFIEEVLICE